MHGKIGIKPPFDASEIPVLTLVIRFPGFDASCEKDRFLTVWTHLPLYAIYAAMEALESNSGLNMEEGKIVIVLVLSCHSVSVS